MTKRKTLFYMGVGLTAALGLWVIAQSFETSNRGDDTESIPTTKYGAFLAAQHAVYVNDFDSAADLIQEFADVEYTSVKNTRILSEFLAGNMPNGIEGSGGDTNAAMRLIYDAYLVKNDKWDELYKRRGNDKSPLNAPFRIWAAVATGHADAALKYIDNLDLNPLWKAFVRGQIYAVGGDVKHAVDEFARVEPEFLNINDYLYIMSFYTKHELHDAAQKLRADYISSSGGMTMAGYNDIPSWAYFDGVKNTLAFDVVQNVAHTNIMLYSELSLLMLRFAQIVGPDTPWLVNSTNYYLGQFFANTRGDYARYFGAIDKDSPYYIFGQMRCATIENDTSAMRRILKSGVLFIPAIDRLVLENVKNGNMRTALRTINRALRSDDLSTQGRAYLLKRRAFVYLMFNDLKRAQADIHDVAKIQSPDNDILSVQAKIWAAQNREIENAYEYAMTMVKKNPTDVLAWDTLSVVVLVREGNDAALEILEKVGASANHCSSLFEHLGDAYLRAGDTKRAHDAYMRAISLSDDGLIVVPNVKKKLKRLK